MSTPYDEARMEKIDLAAQTGQRSSALLSGAEGGEAQFDPIHAGSLILGQATSARAHIVEESYSGIVSARQQPRREKWE